MEALLITNDPTSRGNFTYKRVHTMILKTAPAVGERECQWTGINRCAALGSKGLIQKQNVNPSFTLSTPACLLDASCHGATWLPSRRCRDPSQSVVPLYPRLHHNFVHVTVADPTGSDLLLMVASQSSENPSVLVNR